MTPITDEEDPAKEDDSPSEDDADLEQENPDVDTDTPEGGDISGSKRSEGDEDGDPDDEEEDIDPDPDPDEDEERKQMIPKSRLDEVIQERNDLRKREETYLELLGKKKDGSDATQAEKDAAKQHAIDTSKYDPDSLKEFETLHGEYSKQDRAKLTAFEKELEQMKAAQAAEQQAKFREEDQRKLQKALESPEAKGVTESKVMRHLQRLESSGDPEKKALANGPYKYIIQDYKEWRETQVNQKKKKPTPKIEKSPDSQAPKPQSPGGDYDRSNPLAAKAAIARRTREFYESTGDNE